MKKGGGIARLRGVFAKKCRKLAKSVKLLVGRKDIISLRVADNSKQTIITQTNLSRFPITLLPHEQDRVVAVGLLKFKLFTRCSESLIRVARAPSPRINNLSHRLMNNLNLCAPLNGQIKLLLIVYPVLRSRFHICRLTAQSIHRLISSKNDFAHETRSQHASHDKLAYLPANLASPAAASLTLADTYSSAAQCAILQQRRTLFVALTLSQWLMVSESAQLV